MRVLACLVLVLAWGCDGEAAPEDSGRVGMDAGPVETDAGGDGGVTDDAEVGDADVGDGGADGGVETDAGPAGPCPGALPSAGASCGMPGLVCTYGDDPRLACRDRAECTDAGWTVEMPDCAPLDMSACPPEMPGAVDTCDGMVGAYCEYGETACGCTNCFGGPCGGTAMWDCTMPPPDSRCPRRTPNAGDYCAEEGLTCDYGTCTLGTQASLTCTDGAWRSTDIPCPV
ncbi:MAG: hypothetical protein SangKO_043050 [Sandaracinaceae bacterium]